MEFDANLKREILSNIKDDEAYLSGILTTIGRIESVNGLDNIYISHIMYEIAWDIVRAVRDRYKRSEIEMTFEEPHGNKRVRSYAIIIDNKTTKEMLKDYDLVVIDGVIMHRNNLKSLQGEKLIGYLQGVYLAKGRVFLPKDDEEGKSSLYQLEMVFSSRKGMDYIKDLIIKSGINIKESERRDNLVLYIKDSEIISDFFAMFGASNAVMELQSLIIERDVRNNANRAVNCSVANIGKAIDAASDQIEAIELIVKNAGINSLEENLRELAQLRLNNPEATLTDLAGLLDVTKSCINHRMRKIMQIAENYKE